VVGGKSPPWLHHSVQVFAKKIPGAQLREPPGQDHNVAGRAMAPVLQGFFAEP